MRPSSPRPVFVIGSFVMACCWFTPRLPGRGEHVHAGRFLMEPGGKGLNVAVGLRRLGAAVHLMLGVGQDHATQALHTLLRHEGLPATHVHHFDGPCGHGAGLIDNAGDNVIAVHPGANHLLGPEHAQAAADDLAASAVVYGQFEVPDAVLAEAFRLGRAAGARGVLNPSPWRPVTEEVLSHVDVLLVNEQEACSLFGLPPAAISPDPHWTPRARAWRHAHPGIDLVITLGDAGCLLWTNDAPAPWHRPARPIEAVDTTGCGDAFAAALCLALSNGLSLADGLEGALAAGAWVASRHGVLAALPSREALQAWMTAKP